MSTTKIRIPVLVREDGAWFVWEMDTSSDLKHPGHGDPTDVARRAAVMLTRGTPPFYRDIGGKPPERSRLLSSPHHGATRLVFIEVDVATPTPILEAAVVVEGTVEDPAP